ncbi:unnamed protein product, partial [Lampetra planeri]
QQPNYWSFKVTPTQPALADQASRVSFASAENLETMSEPDLPIGFNRMNRLRQSLPLARSSSQAKLRAPGILFLQLGEETRRVHLTHELTGLETLRALIVHMFPQRLTMAMLRSPSTALLIKDETRNVFYELEDPRDVQDRCVIKIYCKEPIYGTYPGHHNPHLANGDLRREMVYAPQDSSPNRRLSNPPMSSQHSSSSASPPQGSPSPRPPSPVPVSRLQMQLHLQGLQQNTIALRKQLSQLRNMQLENQDSVLSLLRQTESELSLMMLDAMRTQEDPLQRQRLLVEEERLKYLNQEELLIQQLHDLEKSVEELQRNSSVSHGLVTEQDVEQKSKELRMLGETLTELKNQFPSLQSKMRVVLRVEVEAVKFLKEEPHRLDALLKRCNTMSDALSTLRRQVTEGVWKGPDDVSGQSQKRAEEASRNSDLNMLNSPPLSLTDLSTSAGLANWMPVSAVDADATGPEQDLQPPMTFRNRVLDELPSRRPADKSVSAEAAERDWEEKRASLTQFSAQDINRLLEETQAELMKAIPDLDFAAKHINKPAVPPKPQITIPITSTTATSSPCGTSGMSTATTTPSTEQFPGKVQLAAQKLNSLEGAGSHRGSVDLSLARYRTEKPSKSPPPPPPRRSFPSVHGLTTNRTGEVVVTNKSARVEEDGDLPKSLVKLRRTPSDAPRPASTPPVIAASAIQDEDDEEKIIAELEVFQRTPVNNHKRCSTLPKNPPTCTFGSPGRKNSTNSPGPMKGSTVAARLKHLQQGSLERPKTRKQKEDFPKVQSQQQVFHF